MFPLVLADIDTGYLSDDTFRKVCVSLADYFGDKVSKQPNRYLSPQPLIFEDKTVNQRCCMEVSNALLVAEDNDSLLRGARELCSLKFIMAKLQCGLLAELVNDFNQYTAAFRSAQSSRSSFGVAGGESRLLKLVSRALRLSLPGLQGKDAAQRFPFQLLGRINLIPLDDSSAGVVAVRSLKTEAVEWLAKEAPVKVSPLRFFLDSAESAQEAVFKHDGVRARTLGTCYLYHIM